MPIPEPGIHRPPTLNAKQRREQIAAVYGVQMPKELTALEIERMRQIVQEHDLQSKPVQTIDLNNPPKVPYRHQKFPMVVYDHERSYPARDETRTVVRGSMAVQERIHVAARISSKLVHSEEELREARAEGWSELAPEFREEEQEPLSEGYQQEADQAQERIEETRRKRKGHAA
jgi:hypothetical protein